MAWRATNEVDTTICELKKNLLVHPSAVTCGSMSTGYSSRSRRFRDAGALLEPAVIILPCTPAYFELVETKPLIRCGCEGGHSTGVSIHGPNAPKYPTETSELGIAWKGLFPLGVHMFSQL